MTEQIRSRSVGSADAEESDDDQQYLHSSEEESTFTYEGSWTGRRGRPKIQDCWTRVISMSKDQPDRIKLFKLSTELLLQSGLPMEAWHIEAGSWDPIFYPKQLVKDIAGVTLEQAGLST